MSLEVGQMAPEFEAKIETGETIKLSDYKGKKVVLYFYPKADLLTAVLINCVSTIRN